MLFVCFYWKFRLAWTNKSGHCCPTKVTHQTNKSSRIRLVRNANSITRQNNQIDKQISYTYTVFFSVNMGNDRSANSCNIILQSAPRISVCREWLDRLELSKLIITIESIFTPSNHKFLFKTRWRPSRVT